MQEVSDTSYQYEALVGSYVVKPSAAIGEVDYGLYNVVNNLGDLDRGDVAGFRGVVRGNYRLLMPRISKRDYEILMTSRLPDVPGYLEDLVAGMTFMSASARADLLRRKRAVRQDMGNGTDRVILVDRQADGMDEVDMAIQGVEQCEFSAVALEDLASRRKTKKYSLSQVFQDVSVLDKYAVKQRHLETAKRLAVSNPRAAARLVQDSMNLCQTDVNVKVFAGDYVRDRSHARNSLCVVCFGYKPTSAAVLSDVIGDELFMYGPGGPKDWHVSGPLKYAREVSYLYWMVSVEGIVNPSCVLEMEMVVLGLNVSDGNTCMAPSVQYHAGYDGAPMPPAGISERTAALLSAEHRGSLEKMADRLLPVMGSDGMQLATAVRVTELHVLVNSHVLDADPLCTISGQQVEAHAQLSRDLWSTRLRGSAGAWSMREPLIGELVAVCYVISGRVSCSAPMQVLSVDESCVVTSLSDDVMARMSGGALVALSDMALLGVHSASTWSSLISYRFGAKQFSTLLESVSESCFSRQGDVSSFAGRIFEHFKKRGLGGVFSTAVKSLVPVFIGPEHVGMAVSNGGWMYTACDAEYPLRFGSGKIAYVMETAEVGSLYRVKASLTEHTPVYRRTAVNFEKVFVVGYDTDAYVSSESSVLHVGPNGRSFVIESLPGVDKPVTGGLVMGFDGAVLGVCGSLSASTAAGLGYVCWPLPGVKSTAPMDVKSILAVKFPFLNMAGWSDAIVEEVFTHTSAGKYKSGGLLFNAGNRPLANVGDNAAKAELYESLREAGVPHAQWNQSMQSRQSNSNFARLAWEFGFAGCLVVGPGAVFSRESKVYADLTEALLGATYITERRVVFKQLCTVMGILYQTEASQPQQAGAEVLTSPGLGEEASSSVKIGESVPVTYFGCRDVE